MVGFLLTSRSQRVVVDHSFSSVCPVLSGVPQGSVLGPILFLAFINDIPETCSDGSAVKMFADDVKLFSEIASQSFIPSISLQSSLDNLSVWSGIWQLSINPSKCHVLSISQRSLETSPRLYKLGGTFIDINNYLVDLGVTVTSDLSYKIHINNIVASAYRRIGTLFRGFSSRDPLFLRRAFITYIRPLLEYNSIVWNPSEIYLIDLLESVQRSFTRRVPSLSHLSYHSRLSELNLEPLELRRIRFDLIYYFKILSHLTPFDPTNYLNIRYTPPSSQSFHIHLLKPVKGSNKLHSSFFFRNTNIYNDLPDELKSASSLI